MCLCVGPGIPVTNGHQEVFWCGREELKVGNVQLLHLDGLTELNNKPGRTDLERGGRKKERKKERLVSMVSQLGGSTGTLYPFSTL